MSVKSALSCAAVLLVGATALTACGSDHGASANGSAPSRPAASSSAPATTAAPTPAPSSASPSPSASRSAAVSTAARTASQMSGSSAAGGGYATSDSYAWKHPCSAGQISVHVLRRASAPTQRVIEVRNNGTRSCGLSYYPHVVLWNAESATGGVTVTPLVPDGLGGPPATPVYAGRTAYAVIDLDPSGATKGTASGVDEMNVLADGDHMTSRQTLRFPLGAGARVLDPKLGLYEDDIADAVASMRTADIRP